MIATEKIHIVINGYNDNVIICDNDAYYKDYLKQHEDLRKIGVIYAIKGNELLTYHYLITVPYDVKDRIVVLKAFRTDVTILKTQGYQVIEGFREEAF